MSTPELDEATRLTTQPKPVEQPRRGDPFGPLRLGWRQLTSMRTALLLLFLLALASVPGGFLPQRKINPVRVSEYIRSHGAAGRFMDRIGLFDVFSSVWFSAIYLLLFISLVGCLIPRSRLHLRALTARPPKVPKTLKRLPVSDAWVTAAPVESVLDDAREALRGWRVERRGSELSAEKGYLRETGNLIFHISLVLLLIGIALNSFYGFKGTVLVVEGKGFSNTLALYDDVQPAKRFNPSSLVPFTVGLTQFHATYGDDGKALTFDADITWSRDGKPSKAYDLRVNHPLVVGNAKTYLIGHGYAPHIVFRDVDGNVVDDSAVPCLPQDPQFLSTCVIKEPLTKATQFGFRGVFTPTTVTDAAQRVGSSYPGLRRPALTLVAFTGDLSLDGGTPQSVYSLDTTAMKAVDKGQAHALQPGQTWVLPGGASLTYVDTPQWANLQVTQDPSRKLMLVAAIGIVGGLLLSLFIRRRRVWVRAGEGADGTTTVEVGGLARTDPERFASEFAELVTDIRRERA
ncbi:MAG: cytochrome c biosis protein [Frankiales bacterium]|nr:cytochrome c biosis protein [Frankiales bacterium]